MQFEILYKRNYDPLSLLSNKDTENNITERTEICYMS